MKTLDSVILALHMMKRYIVDQYTETFQDYFSHGSYADLSDWSSEAVEMATAIGVIETLLRLDATRPNDIAIGVFDKYDDADLGRAWKSFVNEGLHGSLDGWDLPLDAVVLRVFADFRLWLRAGDWR